MTGKPNIDLKDLITPDQLCDLLQVDKTWVYRQTREGTIPFIKMGKYLRFQRSNIEKWLIQCQVNR